LFYGTAHKGAPHIGALFFFKGQKTRFRPIFSAIPHGSFFLINAQGSRAYFTSAYPLQSVEDMIL
jgi:hypothetical protein